MSSPVHLSRRARARLERRSGQGLGSLLTYLGSVGVGGVMLVMGIGGFSGGPLVSWSHFGSAPGLVYLPGLAATLGLSLVVFGAVGLWAMLVARAKQHGA